MTLRHFSLFIFLSAFFLGVPFAVSSITVEVSATVPGCGDGAIVLGEQCDGENLGGTSCASLGLSGGTLSCTSACTFDASLCQSGSSGGGGGREPAFVPIPSTNVVFSGRGYPLRPVTILKDGQRVLETVAGLDGAFTGTISDLSTGDYSFSAYAEDRNNIRSSLFTFPIHIASGVTTKIGEIFIAPTVGVDKRAVERGGIIAFFGQSAPLAEVSVRVDPGEGFLLKKIADEEGIYLLVFGTSPLAVGAHAAQAYSSLDGEISSLSQRASFIVHEQGDAGIPELGEVASRVDINGDQRVDLVDFSVLAYWYNRPSPPSSSDMNGDAKVDLADLSIMAFYWTG